MARDKDAFAPLDDATEARLQAAFAKSALISARAVARVTGLDYGGVLVDVKLGRLKGAVFGKTWRFTMHHVREYLNRGVDP